jgi:Xaa-Pro aminopeptidase
MSETAEKLTRLRKYLTAKKLDGIILSTRANFAWLSGGGDRPSPGIPRSPAPRAKTVIIDGDKQVVITACSPDWPTVTVKLPKGGTVVRPAILVRS